MAGSRWEQFKALFGDDPPAAAEGAREVPVARPDETARIRELETQVAALRARAESAESALLVAVNDRLTDYLADCQRLGQGQVEAGVIAEGIRTSRDYAKAKALAEEKQAQVFARFPAGTSADVRAATRRPDGDKPEPAADAVLAAASASAKERRERAANGRKP